MTDKFYSTGRVNTDHTTFGGSIYSGDFGEYHTLSDIVGRIVSDWKFDKQCLRNIERMMRVKEK